MKKEGFNFVFWISTVVITVFLLFGALVPETLSHYAEKAFEWMTTYFSSFYLIVAVFFIGFCLFLAFSRYGAIKLGQDSDEPEYTYYNWIGMLFSAGFGVALVFWGVSEPVKHYISPPPGYEGETEEAIGAAIQYSMFHWGIHQWAIFAVIGLCIAYFQFRKQKQGLISTAVEPLMKNKFGNVKGWRSTIDILAVLATATGVATSLGLGVMQVNGGLHYTFGIGDHIGTQLVIIVVLMCTYLFSSITGLNKGIRILSLVNLTIAFFLMAFTFLVGPTLYIFNTFVSGLGGYVENFTKMSFNINPHQEQAWLNDWTVFYWAWAMAWSPFVGTFIARVSKGRTIREFVTGVMFVPPLVAIAWMAVFGGGALFFETVKGYEIVSAVQDDVTNGLFVTLNQFPFGMLLSIVAISLIFTFLITSADSATFVLGMMTSKDQLNPGLGTKIIWGIFMSAIAAILLLASGLTGLQTASLVTALPFSIIMILMCFSLFKELKEEAK
ncbi:glycine/betaine ABC transporter permease [Anaerobacillus arseniciselenatis]|uniref:Glycine/betaine ABC transporter permease n=1 Tax=Anaerobacillus arseniciselenatis TaxID=85682 RepID=A0A1S2L8M6_9BACI|nr:BCCT family transporter [Anaerobacillus arseniciselenatis]OIJ08852.1 glycine/betaine ABC transporter permease [Anaerobacillus arseniciselenatis]